MKTYTTKNIRNIVLIGAPRSGKTTLSEAMLFEGKVIYTPIPIPSTLINCEQVPVVL